MVELVLLEEIKEIRKDLDFIKEHMVDADSIMTEDDYEALQEYRKEKKSGELISHTELMNELEL